MLIVRGDQIGNMQRAVEEFWIQQGAFGIPLIPKRRRAAEAVNRPALDPNDRQRASA